jgi:hypothetical protein
MASACAMALAAFRNSSSTSRGDQSNAIGTFPCVRADEPRHRPGGGNQHGLRGRLSCDVLLKWVERTVSRGSGHAVCVDAKTFAWSLSATMRRS